MSSTSGMIVYLVFIIAIFYFMAIRPQSKEKKKQAELIKEISGVNPLKCRVRKQQELPHPDA